MSELSPAAQAVIAAAINDTADIINKPHCDWIQGYSRQIAAALRAAADQVVSPALEEEFFDRNQALPLKKMVEIRLKLLAIADELENHQ